LLAALALLTATLLQAQNQDLAGDTGLARKLEITVQPGEIIGREQIVRCLVKCGTNQFLFMLPPNVHSSGAASETVELTANDGSFYLSFRILASGSASGDQAGSRKAKTLERFPNARNVEEFAMPVAGHEGNGVQFRQERPPVGSRLIRFLWAPCAAGTLEFSLSADSKHSAVAMQAMECVLLSFQSDERGKIVVIPRPDKT